MVSLNQICGFLDTELRIKEIEDTSLNGLQVNGKEDIKRVCFAVDASLETFQEVTKQEANMVVVHHGLFWNKPELLKGVLYKRLKILFDNEISLYAAHLPLDLHPKFGNNAQLMNLFITKKRVPFGNYHGTSIGWLGKLQRKINLQTAVSKLEEALKIKCHTLAFGKDEIDTIAIISGGGTDLITEAIEQKADLFITGESKLFSYHLSKEEKINVIFAGHYATETLGIKALGEEIAYRFNIECQFIDLPTNL